MYWIFSHRNLCAALFFWASTHTSLPRVRPQLCRPELSPWIRGCTAGSTARWTLVRKWAMHSREEVLEDLVMLEKNTYKHQDRHLCPHQSSSSSITSRLHGYPSFQAPSSKDFKKPLFPSPHLQSRRHGPYRPSLYMVVPTLQESPYGFLGKILLELRPPQRS